LTFPGLQPDKDNIVFKIHGDALAAKSIGFAAMLGFNIEGNDCTEKHEALPPLVILDGMSEDNPICLPDTSAYEFECLLHCIYSGSVLPVGSDLIITDGFCRWDFPPDLDAMAAVLKLSDRWICAEPKKYAINEINRINSFPITFSVNPCRLLELSRRFRVDEWIRPAFQELVAIPVHTLSLEDIRAMGDRNYTALSRCQSTIQHLRLAVSATTPAIGDHAISCTSPRSCENAWKSFWWNEFAKDYLTIPLSGRDAMAYLDDARPEQVNLDCKHKVFVDITAKGILNAEVSVVFRTVQALIAQQCNT
jgi:hypothetical protein